MRGITKKRNGLSVLPVALACMTAGLLAIPLSGCAGGQASDSDDGADVAKTFVYGTTGYGVEMEDDGLNPHDGYSGWSAVRYGVGETLFRFSDSMEPEPWLATGYEFTDDTHCVITLRDGVAFTSGRAMDGQAVKECLDDLIATNDRAPLDMKIADITADGQTVTIETSEPCPALVNYLCDPYGAIIDMQAGVTEDENVSGTGPYRATSVSETEIDLVPNEDYWNGTPQVDKVVVRSITDGDTLTNALQSGEIDASYGLPYASYSLFDGNSAYSIAGTNTSRAFFGQVNYESPIMQDEAVRHAIAEGIDREGFVSTLLDGRGAVAEGPFPDELPFGDTTVDAPAYDPEDAKATLEETGWVDEDGDGVREKDGQRLTLRWLTYPGRMELPLLAESAQATLGEIGFDVQVNSTSNHSTVRKDTGAWDIYASALVTAPTGDPEYFFSTHAVDGAAANYGGYRSDEMEGLYGKLHAAFDADERAKLGTQMSQLLLDDDAMVFASHLTMGIVCNENVTGLVPHPCDYYEITVDLDVE